MRTIVLTQVTFLPQSHRLGDLDPIHVHSSTQMDARVADDRSAARLTTEGTSPACPSPTWTLRVSFAHSYSPSARPDAAVAGAPPSSRSGW